jgi:hypothetical protein
METVQESFQRTLAVKEQELRVAKEMMRDLNTAFEQVHKDLDNKLTYISNTIHNPS